MYDLYICNTLLLNCSLHFLMPKQWIVLKSLSLILHTVPASPQGHSRCCRCHGARCVPVPDCQRRSSPSLPSPASYTASENLRKHTRSYCVTFGLIMRCVAWRVQVSHQDILLPSDTRNGRTRSYRFPGEQAMSGVPHHQKEGCSLPC